MMVWDERRTTNDDMADMTVMVRLLSRLRGVVIDARGLLKKKMWTQSGLRGEGGERRREEKKGRVSGSRGHDTWRGKFDTYSKRM
jgi:hypothetical protein